MSLMTRKHRETAIVMAAGLIVIVALNVMMLFYHYDLWTNPKVGFWTAFWNKFEVSGFDSYTYIIISKWRPSMPCRAIRSLRPWCGRCLS